MVSVASDPEYKDILLFLCGHLNTTADEIDNDIDVQEGIYWFANNWHGGQVSNLYKVLSQSKYRPGPLHNGPASRDGKRVASALVGHFIPKDQWFQGN